MNIGRRLDALEGAANRLVDLGVLCCASDAALLALAGPPDSTLPAWLMTLSDGDLAHIVADDAHGRQLVADYLGRRP